MDGTPVREIPQGARFRHWCHGVVTVTDRVMEHGRVLLKLDTDHGPTADAYRPNTKLQLIEEGK